jgi:hypothetical protein
VFELRLAGAQLHNLRDYARENGWNVSDGQLWRYTQKADALIKERFDPRADYLLAKHILQRSDLYARAVAAGDHRTALAILDSEAKLENLFPVHKVALTDPTGEREFSGGFTDADRAAALDRLYARLGAGGGAPPADRPAEGDGCLLGGPGSDSQ